MPSDSVNIGKDSEKTWAALRSPLFKGTGYREYFPYIVPYNSNWSEKGIIPTPHNAGYEQAIGNPNPLIRAFPFKVFTGFGTSATMCLGVHYLDRIVSPPSVPPVYQVDNFLSIGIGYFVGTEDGGYSELVYCGSWDSADQPVQPDDQGYDFHATRDTFRGAVVNLTINDGVNPPLDFNVTIDDSMFPDNQDADALVGIMFYSFQHDGSWVEPTPYWTINSVTMPS
jgi:hypothetical protein